MNWESVYLICFGVGLVLSIVAAIGGMGHLHLGHGHLHFGHSAARMVHAPAHGASGSNSGNISPFNGFTMMAFLCWFGGTGYLLHHLSTLLAPVVLGFSVVSGAAGAWFVFLFLTKVLLPNEHTLTAEETEVVGVLARVSSAIRPGGVGEIIFSQNGSRRACPARGEDQDLITKESEVVVMRYERGVAYVRRWDDLTGEPQPRAPRESGAANEPVV